MNPGDVGKQVSRLRKERGMTQRELAGELCVTDKAVSKWETGGGLPDIAILPALASALDVSIDELLLCRVEGAPSARVRRSGTDVVAAAQCVLLVICLTTVFLPSGLAALWDAFSLTLVLTLANAAAYAVMRLRGDADYVGHLIRAGFPIAVPLTMIALAASNLPRLAWASHGRLMLLPLCYAALGSLAAYALMRLRMIRAAA